MAPAWQGSSKKHDIEVGDQSAEWDSRVCNCQIIIQMNTEPIRIRMTQATWLGYVAPSAIGWHQKGPCLKTKERKEIIMSSTMIFDNHFICYWLLQPKREKLLLSMAARSEEITNTEKRMNRVEDQVSHLYYLLVRFFLGMCLDIQL